MKHETKLLTPAQVAQSLGFRPRTVARWCREGHFPEARKVGRVWRIPVDDPRLQYLVRLSGIEHRPSVRSEG